MRSRIFSGLFMLLFSIFLAGCELNPFAKKAGIQVTSHPDSNVVIDGKSVGKTPYYVENAKPGTVSVQMTAVDSGQSWEGKVTLTSGTLTTIHREFGTTPDKSHSYSLSFEKLSNTKDSSVNIISLPASAAVSIGGKPSGFTPTSVDIAPGQYIFSFTAPGYQDKIINATVQAGYRLNLYLTMSSMDIVPTPTPTPIATPSGTINPTPTKKTTEITPLPKQATSSATLVKPYVEILNTPTGWLKVRSTTSATSEDNVISKVNPGDKFPYKEPTVVGWYNIEYIKGSWGFVSSQYAKLIK